jgi:hypothetical protein
MQRAELWHWIFAFAAGVFGGWSLAGLLSRPPEREERGHLLRALLSAAAVVGFAYTGWVLGGAATAGLTLLVSAAGFGLGLAFGTSRMPRRPAPDANDEPPPAD